MQVYEIIITKQGNRNPIKNNVFFIDFPFFFNIVHENVVSSKPILPHIPKIAGN